MSHSSSTRRNLLGALGLVLLGWRISVDAEERKARVGVLFVTPMNEGFRAAFLEGMRQQGFIEGRNLLVEWRAADGRPELAEALATELVAMKVDVIVAVYASAAHAARKATSTIPIVMTLVGDPLRTGLIKSLARPGGNVTGLSSENVEISGKRISLLRELIPGLTRIGVLFNSASMFSKPFVEEIRSSATRLGLELYAIDVRKPDEVDAAFATMKKSRVGAVIIQALVITDPKAMADSALRHRLPTISSQKPLVRAGGLLSYGVNYDDQVRRAAGYVSKILRGARPADLPVEQATEFDFLINRGTARTLGLTIPSGLLTRADEVID